MTFKTILDGLDEAVGLVDYLISWPASAPLDAYRNGKEYNIVVAILAFFFGWPVIPLRFVIGGVMATYNYGTA